VKILFSVALHQQEAVQDKLPQSINRVLMADLVVVPTELLSTQALQDKVTMVALAITAVQLQQLQAVAVEQVQSVVTQLPLQVLMVEQVQHLL
jgi:ribosomal protein L18E